MDSSRAMHGPTAMGEFLAADWSQWMHWEDEDAFDGISDQPVSLTPSLHHLSTSKPVMASHNTQLPRRSRGHSSVASMDSNSHLSLLHFSSPVSTNSVLSAASTPALPSQHLPQMYQHTITPSLQVPGTTVNAFPSRLSASPSGQKRKLSSVEDVTASTSLPNSASSSGASTLPSKKRSHNVIEKRYRANLNDKIAELRDSVPSLRAIHRQRTGGPGKTEQDDEDDEETVISGNKLNKASILSKATEYIRHLEVRNKRLDEENLALKNRLRELDRLQQQQGMMSFHSASAPASSPSGFTNWSDSAPASSPGVYSHTEDSPPKDSPNPLYPPEGLLKVPDSFRRMRAASRAQPHYADSILSQKPPSQDPNRPQGGGRPGKLANKFMLGSLAGLMVVGGLDQQKRSDSTDKGLLSLPLHLLDKLRHFAYHTLSQGDVTSWRIRALSRVALTSIFVVGGAFLVFLYLFYSRPREPRDESKTRSRQSTSAAITPAEFRRQAWLTSIQTVRVPQHNFFPEWYAVTSRCLEYCLRCLLGWRLYSWLTGISEEDEKGRVKTWDIALDAQLAGGDAEVSKSRLVLTIFASGTLPRSPARCMQKALHCRILFWTVGVPGSPCEIPKRTSFALARYQWRLAQQLQRTTHGHDENYLPTHLAFLLTMDCDEVLTDPITQRAFNMIWNRPTQEASSSGEDLLDAIVEDTSICSPLDAIAAWWSSTALREALVRSIDCPAAGRGSQNDDFKHELDLALQSAPVTSTAYTRAAAIKAVFFDQGRMENIKFVLAALQPPKRNSSTNSSLFVDTSVPASARGEISIAVRCAMIAASLSAKADAHASAEAFGLSVRDAIDLFNNLPVDPAHLTLLSFASLYHLLRIVATDDRLLRDTSAWPPTTASSQLPSPEDEAATQETIPLPDIARVAHALIEWVRKATHPSSRGLTRIASKDVIQSCVDACQTAGIHFDADETSDKMIQDAELIESEFSGDDTDEWSVSDVESDHAAFERRRSGSVRSDDTGYGSLGLVEDSLDEVDQGETKLCSEPIDPSSPLFRALHVSS